MSGLDICNWSCISSHQEGCKSTSQATRNFIPELEVHIKQEIHKVLDEHPIWLANIVREEKEQKIQCCDLNEACPKDEFSLPNIEMLGGATIEHSTFSLLQWFHSEQNGS